MKISHKLTDTNLGKLSPQPIFYIGKLNGEDILVDSSLKWNQ